MPATGALSFYTIFHCAHPSSPPLSRSPTSLWSYPRARLAPRRFSRSLSAFPSLSFLPPSILVGILFTRRRVHDEKSRVRSYIRRENGTVDRLSAENIADRRTRTTAGRFFATVTEYNRRMRYIIRNARDGVIAFLPSSFIPVAVAPPPSSFPSQRRRFHVREFGRASRGGPRERIAEFRRDLGSSGTL